MLKITGKQSKAARGLLKWNVHDLTSRCTVQGRRIESFERGTIQLQMPENDELVRAYKAEGIEFKGDMEVKLANTTTSTTKSRGSSIGIVVNRFRNDGCN